MGFAIVPPELEFGQVAVQPAEAQLKADATLSGNALKVRVSVEGIESESKDLKVQIALVEKELAGARGGSQTGSQPTYCNLQSTHN